MHGLGAADPGRDIDWGRTSDDYALFRPGPPDSFYAKLAALGVGLPGQRILDLGTGTGVLARRFAAEGARCAGIDVAAGQIEAARRLAQESGLSVDFRVAPAEALPFPAASFDVVTASQCWLYFDAPRAIAEARRVAPGGILMVAHFSWLPRLDPVARASEALVLEFNPQWSAADWAGDVPPVPAWATGLRLTGFFVYDAPIPFTRETWRGRMRACRGIGAGLAAEEVAAFDAAHEALLARIAPPAFTVLHRLDARLFALDG
jgi:SAM-dependent methyltransferase